MNLFADAFDELTEVLQLKESFTVSDHLKVAEIKALLAISQELSQIYWRMPGNADRTTGS